MQTQVNTLDETTQEIDVAALVGHNADVQAEMMVLALGRENAVTTARAEANACMRLHNTAGAMWHLKVLLRIETTKYVHEGV